MREGYIIRKKYIEMKPKEIWFEVVKFVNNNEFFSADEEDYRVWINKSSIFFKGGKKSSDRAKKGEIITKKSFFDGCKEIQKTKVTNTKKIKKGISNNYNATPLIGLFLTVGVIKK